MSNTYKRLDEMSPPDWSRVIQRIQTESNILESEMESIKNELVRSCIKDRIEHNKEMIRRFSS